MRHWIVAIGLVGTSLWAANQPYKASEVTGSLELQTPYGKKTVIGEMSNTNYRLEIPIADLKGPMAGFENPDGTHSRDTESKESKESKETKSENSTVESKETKIIETKIIEHDGDGEGGSRRKQKVVVEYDDTDRLVLEANRLYYKKKFAESTNVVEELIRRKPTYVRAWIMKGSLMFVRGQRDLAQAAWKQALELEPENGEIKQIMERYK